MKKINKINKISFCSLDQYDKVRCVCRCVTHCYCNESDILATSNDDSENLRSKISLTNSISIKFSEPIIIDPTIPGVY